MLRERKMSDPRKGLLALPLVRGVVTLVEALRLGMQALRFSSELYEQDLEQAEREGNASDGQGSATPGQATVYALSGTGRVLEQADLPGSGALAMAVAACSGFNGGVRKVSGSSASGSPGSTSSGSTGSPSSRAPAASAKPIGG